MVMFVWRTSLAVAAEVATAVAKDATEVEEVAAVVAEVAEVVAMRNCVSAQGTRNSLRGYTSVATTKNDGYMYIYSVYIVYIYI